MAIGATAVWEFQTGGSDANGGGYTSGGIDYSTSTSAHATLTTLSVVAATTTDITVNAADYTVTSNDIGNIYYNSGGTSTAGFYEIISIPVAGTWRLDRSIGTAAQTCAGSMGGCRNLISSNSFLAGIAAGNTIYIKSGAYTTAAWSGQTGGTATAPVKILGYNSSRGDNPTGANRPALTASGTNAITFAGSTIVKNLALAGGATAQVNVGVGSLENCKITCTNATSTSTALVANNDTKIVNCEIIAASCRGVKGSSVAVIVHGCWIHGCNVGIYIDNNRAIVVTDTIISGCTTAIYVAGSILNSSFINCTLFGAETPAGTGIDGSSTTAPISFFFQNNIIYGFTTGVNFDVNNLTTWWDYNCFFNNTTNRTNVTAGAHDVALDPTFTSTAGNNFAIGTNLKAGAFPGAFQTAASTGYKDIGAVQRQEAGGGTTAFTFS